MAPAIGRAPASLSHLQPYLDRADELQPADPKISYHLRVLAASAGLRHCRDPSAKTFLFGLMDAIEAERSSGLQATPTDDEAIRRFALGLFNRAKHSDKPDVLPSPHADWAVTEAPRVAQCYHASAVVFDAARQYAPLPPEEAKLQRYAYLRSAQLSQQLSKALSRSACVPPAWRPLADGDPCLPSPQPAEPPAAEEPEPVEYLEPEYAPAETRAVASELQLLMEGMGVLSGVCT